MPLADVKMEADPRRAGNNDQDEGDFKLSNYTSYRVLELSDDTSEPVPNSECVTYSFEMSRNRKRFSKTLLRRFVKDSAIRESTMQSPWIVKPAVAEKLHLKLDYSRYDLKRKNLDELERPNDSECTNNRHHATTAKTFLHLRCQC